MKIYKDSSLKEEITILDLGIVQAGETKKFEFYIYNETGAYLKKLNFSINHSEIKILTAPNELAITKGSSLIFEWNPSITLKEGLKTQLNIKGEELWL